MRTLYLDLSSKVIGWCTFNDDRYKKSGSEELDKNKNIDHRIYDAALFIKELMLIYNPQKVVIEDIYCASKDVYKKLAWLQGCVINICVGFNINYILIYPNKWKSYVGIKPKRQKKKESEQLEQTPKAKSINKTRKIEKIASINKVKELYNIDVKTDDEADALCMAYYYIYCDKKESA